MTRASPVSAQHLGHLVDEGGPEQRAGRHVDAHRGRWMGRVLARPAGGPLAGLPQHPPVDLADQTGLLGQRDELVGRQQPLARDEPSGPAPRTRPACRWPRRGRAGSARPAGPGPARPAGRRGAGCGAARSRAWPGRRSRTSPCRAAWRRTSPRPRRAARRRRACPRPLGAHAMPRLARAAIRRPVISTGASSAAISRCAVATAGTSSSTSSSSTANSSPAKRARVSPSRTHSASRWPDLDEQLVAAAVPQGVVDRLEVVEVKEDHRDAAALLGPAGQGVRRPGWRTAPGWPARSARRGRPGGAAVPPAACAR